MLVAHAALVREFRLAPTAVSRVKPGDRKHARDVDEYLAMMCFTLHAHHDGEDKILWPVLRARLSAAESRLLHEIEIQHANINDSIERVNEARRRWLDQPDRNHGGELADKLQTLYELVTEHVEDEERDILPMAAAYLSEAEWHAMNEGGKDVLSLKEMLFVCRHGLLRVKPRAHLGHALLAFGPSPTPPDANSPPHVRASRRSRTRH
jgi:hemerythrin-like domain-containing protein